MIYLVGKGADQVTIIPIAGKELWSTVYGFLALEGLQHGQRDHLLQARPPGLGGSVRKVVRRTLSGSSSRTQAESRSLGWRKTSEPAQLSEVRWCSTLRGRDERCDHHR